MIVAGERRWQAHRVAKLKTIQAFVKKYSDDGQWMVESLIENVHREDLGNLEKAKYLLKIKNQLNLNNKQLSEKVRISEAVVKALLSILPIENEIKKSKQAYQDYDTLSKIASIEDKKVREHLLKKADTTENFRQVVRAVKKSPTEVKDALLDDKISVEQAENLSKIKNERAREKAEIRRFRQASDLFKTKKKKKNLWDF
jgi:ParB-like chromosome segregation protein Spo0J